jgi:hypothetical protein
MTKFGAWSFFEISVKSSLACCVTQPNFESWVKLLKPPITVPKTFGRNSGFAHMTCRSKSRVSLARLSWPTDPRYDKLDIQFLIARHHSLSMLIQASRKIG